MKTIALLFFWLCAFYPQDLSATNPSWTWAKQAGRAKGDRANAVAVDQTGNIFITCDFQNYHVKFEGSTIYNNGIGSDIFIVMHDSSMNPKWYRTCGGLDHDVATDLQTDLSGNIYVTGYFFSSEATFGSTTLENSGISTSEIFIAKLNNYGTFQWAQRIRGNGNDAAYALCTDSSGNVYIAGSYESDSLFAGFDTLLNSNTGTSDVFISKLDSSGNFLWTKRAGGLNEEIANSLCRGMNGEIYMAGNFNSSSAAFGPTILLNAGGSDLFLSRLDSTGNFIWTNSYGSAGEDSAYCLSSDPSANIYLTGGFSSDSINLGGINLFNSAPGESDAFIAKLDLNATGQWCKSVTGSGHETITGVSNYHNGVVNITGSFTSAVATLDTFSLSNTSASSDIFIALIDSNGSIVWVRNFIGDKDDQSTGIAIDWNDNVISVGYFSSSGLIFGPYNLFNCKNRSPYYARYTNSGTAQWASQILFSNVNDDVSDMTTDSEGNVIVLGSMQSSSLQFDSLIVYNDAALVDLFIVKYDSTGTVVWTKTAMSTGSIYPFSINTDPFDNILVTGYISDTTYIDSIMLTGFLKIFVAKLDNDGNVLWAKTYGDDGYGAKLCSDDEGNIYVEGAFHNVSFIVLGQDTLYNSSTTSSYEIFILKLDSSGNVLWARSALGNGNELPRGLTVDHSSNIYFTGSFGSDTLTLGSLQVFKNGLHDDVFLAKYDSSGTPIWLTSAGGYYREDASALCVDPSGNLYFTGYFQSDSIVFGSTTLLNYSTNTPKIFIVKYKPDGSVSWAETDGISNSTWTYDIEADAGGRVYLTGMLSGITCKFGPFTLHRIGYDDFYIVQFDSSGNVLYALNKGGYMEYVPAISTYGSDALYIAGNFTSYYLSLGSDTLSCMGGYNIFVSRMDGMLFTSLPEAIPDYDLMLFPNPFASSATLETKDFLKNASLVIYNIFGQAVAQINGLHGYTVSIRRNNLPAGLYFAELTQEGKMLQTKKFIISD